MSMFSLWKGMLCVSEVKKFFTGSCGLLTRGAFSSVTLSSESLRFMLFEFLRFFKVSLYRGFSPALFF